MNEKIIIIDVIDAISEDDYYPAKTAYIWHIDGQPLYSGYTTVYRSKKAARQAAIHNQTSRGDAPLGRYINVML